jgi:hypothetical protein
MVPGLRSDRTLPRPTCLARCLRCGAPPLRVTWVETGASIILDLLSDPLRYTSRLPKLFRR